MDGKCLRLASYFTRLCLLICEGSLFARSWRSLSRLVHFLKATPLLHSQHDLQNAGSSSFAELTATWPWWVS